MMEDNFKNMTNDILDLKSNIRQIVNKYNIKYLGIDIFTDEKLKEQKDISLSIEL